MAREPTEWLPVQPPFRIRKRCCRNSTAGADGRRRASGNKKLRELPHGARIDAPRSSAVVMMIRHPDTDTHLVVMPPVGLAEQVLAPVPRMMNRHVDGWMDRVGVGRCRGWRRHACGDAGEHQGRQRCGNSLLHWESPWGVGGCRHPGANEPRVHRFAFFNDPQEPKVPAPLPARRSALNSAVPAPP